MFSFSKVASFFSGEKQETKTETSLSPSQVRLFEVDEPQKECPITLKSFLDADASEKISQISCGHLFETGIIKKHLAVKDACPVCQVKVDKNSFGNVTPEFFKALHYAEKLKAELIKLQAQQQTSTKEPNLSSGVEKPTTEHKSSIVSEKPKEKTNTFSLANFSYAEMMASLPSLQSPPPRLFESKHSVKAPNPVPISRKKPEDLEAKLLNEARNGTLDSIAAILHLGPNINCVEEKTGDTPLHYIARRKGLERSYELLVINGADEHMVNHAGKSAKNILDDTREFGIGFLQDSISQEDIKLATEALSKAKTVEQARRAVQAGADVNGQDKDGNRPLHWAAFYCAPEVVRYLIQHGADVHAVNKKGYTPLVEMKNLKKIDLEVQGLLLHPEKVHEKPVITLSRR